MKKELFAQCALEREEGKCLVHTVAWIEARHRFGSRVRDEDGTVWTVKEKGSQILPEDIVVENSSDYRRHRRATDI